MTRDCVWVHLSKNGKLYYIEKVWIERLDTAVTSTVIGIVSGMIITRIPNLITPACIEAAAEISDTAKVVVRENEIMKSLKPLLDLLQDLSEPVCYGFLVKGFLKFTEGKEEDAKKTIKYACGGFLGMKFVPQLMKLLRGINIAS